MVSPCENCLIWAKCSNKNDSDFIRHCSIMSQFLLKNSYKIEDGKLILYDRVTIYDRNYFITSGVVIHNKRQYRILELICVHEGVGVVDRLELTEEYNEFIIKQRQNIKITEEKNALS